MLRILSALPNLQRLHMDTTLLYCDLEDHNTLNNGEILSLLNIHGTWSSIRFVTLNYFHRDQLPAIEFVREMLRSHLPNLVGLATPGVHLYWEEQHNTDEGLLHQSAESVRRQLVNLRRLDFEVSISCFPGRIGESPRGMGFLERLSRDFRTLEWLAIRPNNFCMGDHSFNCSTAPSKVRNANRNAPRLVTIPIGHG